MMAPHTSAPSNKQVKLARLLAAGVGVYSAYRQAGYSSIAGNASRAARAPKVVRMIKELKDRDFLKAEALQKRADNIKRQRDKLQYDKHKALTGALLKLYREANNRFSRNNLQDKVRHLISDLLVDGDLATDDDEDMLFAYDFVERMEHIAE